MPGNFECRSASFELRRNTFNRRTIIRHSKLVTRHSLRSQGVRVSARLPAKEKVRGASPRGSAILKLRFTIYELRVRTSALAFQFGIRNSSLVILNGDHDVTAASRPVKAFVPVQVRLVTPNLRWAVELGYLVKHVRIAHHWETGESI